MKSLRLTEAGWDAVRPVWPARRDGLAQLVSGLTPAQRAALSAALQPLLANAPLHPARRRKEPGDDHSDARDPDRTLDQALASVAAVVALSTFMSILDSTEASSRNRRQPRRRPW